VVVADDHAAVRKSLRLLMECDPSLKLVGEAADGLEAIQVVHALQPDLLLTDIKMPQMTGLEVLQYLRNEKNPVSILVLSNHVEPLYVQAAMRLGANGFVAKSSGLEILIDAIQTIRSGRSFVDPTIVSGIPEDCLPQTLPDAF
jgi:two-component system nitrate/nitrite response regulator NarL